MKKDEGQKLYDRKEEDFFPEETVFRVWVFFFKILKQVTRALLKTLSLTNKHLQFIIGCISFIYR